MAGTWTRGVAVKRAFKGGRKRKSDLVYSPKRALLEALVAHEEIQGAMQSEGLRRDGAWVSLVLLSENHADGETDIHILNIPDELGVDALIKHLVETGKSSTLVPVGLKFALIDLEAEETKGIWDRDVWSQQWIMSERAERALFESIAQAAYTRCDEPIYFPLT